MLPRIAGVKRCLAYERAIRPPAEADRDAIVGVDEANGIGEVRQLLRAELGRGSPVVIIGGVGIGNSRYRFGPLQRGTFLLGI